MAAFRRSFLPSCPRTVHVLFSYLGKTRPRIFWIAYLDLRSNRAHAPLFYNLAENSFRPLQFTFWNFEFRTPSQFRRKNPINFCLQKVTWSAIAVVFLFIYFFAHRKKSFKKIFSFWRISNLKPKKNSRKSQENTFSFVGACERLFFCNISHVDCVATSSAFSWRFSWT